MRMDWKKLLQDARFTTGSGRPPPVPRHPARITAFQEDAERIVYSSSFRRLQGKTQVQPLPKVDYVRTRLTHTIEVASAARLIANLVASHLIKHDKTIDWSKTFESPHMAIVDVCVAAALAHDIGNPPFGHIGEYAIQSYFYKKSKEDDPGKVFSFLKDEKTRYDFLNFDGNAQGFRILTRLQGWRQRGGLQLTMPVLGAFSKYPYTAIVGAKKYEKEKYGFPQHDRPHAIRIFDDLGLKPVELVGSLKHLHPTQEKDFTQQGVAIEFARHPLAWITEAADDISYRTTDVEDAYRYGTISFDEAEGLLRPLAESRGHIPRYNDILLEQKSDRLAYVRQGAVSSLIEAVAEAFIGSYDLIMEGNNRTALLEKTSLKSRVAEIAKVCEEKIYVQRDKMEIEAAGCHVIYGLLNQFGEMIYEGVSNGSFKSLTMKSKALYNLMPDEMREQLEPGDGYQSYLVLLDYVSGMTDNYALELFQKVTGSSVSLGRML